MALIIDTQPLGHPAEINGISLFTRSGRLRQRFGERDRMKMLGDCDAELDTFTKLFARRKIPYIRRSLEGNWHTNQHA